VGSTKNTGDERAVTTSPPQRPFWVANEVHVKVHPCLGVSNDRDLVVSILTPREVVPGDVGVERWLRHPAIRVPGAHQRTPSQLYPLAIQPAPIPRGADPWSVLPVQSAGVGRYLLPNVKSDTAACASAFSPAAVDASSVVVAERLAKFPLPVPAGERIVYPGFKSGIQKARQQPTGGEMEVLT